MATGGGPCWGLPASERLILWNSSSTPKKIAPRISAEKDLSSSAFCLFVLFVCLALFSFALLCFALLCFVLFVWWVIFFAEISAKFYGRSLVVESQIPRYWEVEILEASTLLLVRSLSKKIFSQQIPKVEAFEDNVRLLLLEGPFFSVFE